MTSAMVPLVVAAGAAAVGSVAVVELVSAPAVWRARRRLVHRQAPDRQLAPARLVAALDASGVPWPPARCWSVWRCVVGVAAIAGLVAGGPVLALLAAGAAAVVPTLALAVTRDRASRLADAGLPAALDAVARSLRAGASLVQAIGEASTAAPPALAGELIRVTRAVGSGLALTAALDEWSRRQPRPPVRLAVAALGLASEGGGMAARPIDGVAASLRANLAVAAEVRALSSQARYSAIVIALAPLAFGVVAAGADSRTADFLLRSPVGVVCLAAGVALDVAGGWWMHCITRAAS